MAIPSVQPSHDLEATRVAVAWAIVSCFSLSGMNHQEVAKQVHEVCVILRGASPEPDRSARR